MNRKQVLDCLKVINESRNVIVKHMGVINTIEGLIRDEMKVIEENYNIIYQEVYNEPG